jgi:NTP pyrophosphatase (non-canonical NTP hydrolase)
MQKSFFIGIITEASELLEQFRFKSESEIEEMFKDSNKRDSIGNELADVFISLLRFAQRYDFDLSDELSTKITINEITYPASKA